MPDRRAPERPGSPASLKAANRARLIVLLNEAGELSQAEIARRTGLSPATVSNVVRELVDAGVLARTADHPDGSRGRTVSLARSAKVVAGLDFGHRHLTVAVADLGRELLSERHVELDLGHRCKDDLDTAAGLLQEALAEAGRGSDELIGVGMGLPAPIDSRTGKVGSPSILPGWVGVDAATLATEVLGAPVHVDNDANLGVLAEHLWGAGRGHRVVVFLKLSEGVGSGIVVDGRLFRGGSAGTAGEVGHTTMNEYGEVCRCGNRGCLETLVAARVVVALLEPVRGPGLTIAKIVELARNGDAACRRVLADTGRHVGVAVANLCNVLNPERVLVGGELAIAGDLLIDPMRDIVDRYGIPSATGTVEIMPAALGARGPVLGAVGLALREALGVPQG